MRRIFLYLKKRLKNIKNDRKQNICQLVLVNSQGNLENISGYVALFFSTSKNSEKNSKNERKQYICQLFWAGFHGNLENVSVGAIFLHPEKTAKKTPSMKANNTYANFFLANFAGNLENVSSAMWRYFCTSENGQKKNKNERKQYICQLFLASFHGKLENVSGAMWRIFFIGKRLIKTPEMRGSNTYANFFWPIFKQTLKTLVALCGVFFGVPRKTV